MTLQPTKLFCALFAGLSLSACNWVDSTGIQTNSANPGQIARAIEATEKSATTVVPAIDPISADSEWNWGQPTQSGALSACEGVNGFDSSLAAASLQEACTQSDDCAIDFTFKRNSDNRVEFEVNLPSLKAPVGLAYSLSTSNASGIERTEDLVLCAIAINEAPSARDDSFNLRPDITTVIEADDPRNLLSNDDDDVDVRNQRLRVLEEPAKYPDFAIEFSLFPDGGFSYRPQAALTQSNRIVTDSFQYTVTDGLNPATATVTLNIIDNRSNTPPMLEELDDLVLTEGEEFAIPIDADDDDDDPLQFNLSSDTPKFVQVDPQTGTLSGVAEVIGSHTVTVIASDGLAQASASFALFVFEEGNNRPFADDIQNRAVSGQFTYNVSGFFGDRDGDKLFFTAIGMPPGVTISGDGVIRGTASAANRGRHIIRVFVDDGRGGVASDGFRLIIL